MQDSRELDVMLADVVVSIDGFLAGVEKKIEVYRQCPLVYPKEFRTVNCDEWYEFFCKVSERSEEIDYAAYDVAFLLNRLIDLKRLPAIFLSSRVRNQLDSYTHKMGNLKEALNANKATLMAILRIVNGFFFNRS